MSSNSSSSLRHTDADYEIVIERGGQESPSPNTRFDLTFQATQFKNIIKSSDHEKENKTTTASASPEAKARIPAQRVNIGGVDIDVVAYEQDSDSAIPFFADSDNGLQADVLSDLSIFVTVNNHACPNCGPKVGQKHAYLEIARVAYRVYIAIFAAYGFLRFLVILMA